MPAPPRILVTGATGQIGGEVLRLLAERGVAVRALSRRPAGGEALPGVEWVEGDLSAPASLAGAFAGIERFFLLTNNVDAMVLLQGNAIEAARKAGVLHAVKLSALGASDHSRSLIGMWHWSIEQRLERSGLAWTVLRPHHFMQNLFEQRRSIVADGVVRSPAGEGKIPFIDTRDVAAVAAEVLTAPGHAGRTYALTGSQALSYGDATEILAEAIGKPLRFRAEPAEEARERMAAAGRADWEISAQLAIAVYQRAGGPTAETSSAVADLLGRPPRTFREFAWDHAGLFGG